MLSIKRRQAKPFNSTNENEFITFLDAVQPMN